MSRHHVPSKISQASFPRHVRAGRDTPLELCGEAVDFLFPNRMSTPYSSAREPRVGDGRLSGRRVVDGQDCVGYERYQLGSGETSPQSIDLYRQIISTYTGDDMVFSGPPAPRRVF